MAGGVLSYGIPEFRLPKDIVQSEIEGLKELGVKVETDVVIGQTLTIDELLDDYGYEAIFVGSGAGLPKFMGIPGENAKGVYSANEFLTRINLMKAYLDDSETPIEHPKRVAVVGGGNVAMDACRSALRLGAEKVYCVYRRSMAELPARREEVEHAEEEGVDFKLLNNPIEIIEDRDGTAKSNPNYGTVKAIKCIKMELGEPDASGRRSPVAIPGATETIDIDLAIVSVGVSPNPIVPSSIKGLELGRKGTIAVDDNMESSIPMIYAGGDIVRGGATVILAMGDGRKAAAAMNEQLQSK